MGDATFSGAGLGRWPTVYSCVGSLGSFEVSSVGILTVFTDMRSEPSDHLHKRRYVDFCDTASVDFRVTASVDFRGTAFVCCLTSPFAGVHLKSPKARVSSSCLLQVTSHIAGVHYGCRLRRSGLLPVRGSLFCPSSCRVGMPDFRPWCVQGTSLLPCSI